MYKNGNSAQSEQTASPDKYPQGFFKEKPCRICGTLFSHRAPSHLHCSQACADDAYTSRYLQRAYGITTQDYRCIHTEQNGKCAICGGEGFVMNTERHKAKLVVDHDHATGQIRGLLCHNCNRALGLFHDNTETLEAAIRYLKVQRLS